jgi:hypothetical protein
VISSGLTLREHLYALSVQAGAPATTTTTAPAG